MLNISSLLSRIFESVLSGPDDNLIKSIAFFAALLAISAGIIFLFFSRYSNSAIAKMIKESATIRIAVSMICGLIAWFLPWNALKILFLSVSLIVLLSIFTFRRKTGSPRVSPGIIISVLIVAAIIAVINYYPDHAVAPKIMLEIPSVDSPVKNKILPDSEISLEGVDHIAIDVNSGIELRLTDEDDTLHYPSNLSVKEADGKLTLSGPYGKSDTYVIELGTSAPTGISIDCQGIKVEGSGTFRYFVLNCTGALINSHISSENEIRIDCTGIDINGKLEGRTLEIDGLGTAIAGELNFDKIQLNSTATDLSIKATFDRFDIDATGLNGTIEILNPQTRGAELYIDAAGGRLIVDNKNDAPLEMESTSLVKIIRK